jgi:hypothetical protein
MEIQDMSGNGNTGTLVSMSTTTSPIPGKIGGALNFNGNSVNQNVSLSSNLNNSITNQITVSGWVKTSGLNFGNSSGQGVPLSANYNGSTVPFAIFSGYASADITHLEAGFYTGGSWHGTVNTGSFSFQSWALVTATYDGATIKLINGVLNSSLADRPACRLERVIGSLVIGGTTLAIRPLPAPSTTCITCVNAATGITYGKWYHVVMSYNASNTTLAGYVNGVQGAITTATKQYPGQLIEYSIGQSDSTNGGNGSYFSGTIDDVRIYNRRSPPRK